MERNKVGASWIPPSAESDMFVFKFSPVFLRYIDISILDYSKFSKRFRVIYGSSTNGFSPQQQEEGPPPFSARLCSLSFRIFWEGLPLHAGFPGVFRLFQLNVVVDRHVHDDLPGWGPPCPHVHELRENEERH